MTTKRTFLFIFLLTLLSSFKDFEDFWIIKVNGKEVNKSGEAKEIRNTYNLSFKLDSITIKDTIEVLYLQDYLTGDELHTYFVSENIRKENLPLTVAGTYSNERKNLGHISYKVCLLDIYKIGQKTNSKSIRYYFQGWANTKELCKIEFK